jgi:hypothetical protein
MFFFLPPLSRFLYLLLLSEAAFAKCPCPGPGASRIPHSFILPKPGVASPAALGTAAAFLQCDSPKAKRQFVYKSLCDYRYTNVRNSLFRLLRSLLGYMYVLPCSLCLASCSRCDRNVRCRAEVEGVCLGGQREATGRPNMRVQSRESESSGSEGYSGWNLSRRQRAFIELLSDV